MKPYLMLGMLLLLHVCAPCQNRYDIVIDEIMADPTPPAVLPNHEWIELKNTSSSPINLQQWRIGDAAGQSGPMPSFLLQPDSFVIVCASSAAAAMSAWGPTITVTNFPSLDNDGETIYLRSSGGMIVHAVSYSVAWYKNDLKKEGGWTLEMIDPRNPCAGIDNWKASESSQCGTPGRKNSVDGTLMDQSPPRLKQAYTTSDTTIVLVLDEPLDSTLASTAAYYSIDGGLNITGATAMPPLFATVQLTTNTALLPGMVYSLSVRDVTDCHHNPIDADNLVKTGLPADPLAGELVINEILFNPRPGGYDYVELYNHSEKIVDASRLYIANRNTSGTLTTPRAVSQSPFYVFPGDYIVLTENADVLGMHYLVKYPERVLTLTLPSLPDNEGNAVVLNFQGDVIDEVRYRDDWHFKLIANPEGVALERIDPNAPSTAANWHSAASTAGYGTPGYRNSQYKRPEAISATIQIAPPVFSPDNDGIDDIASIQYKVESTGYVANITIFDGAGRPVRNLVRNALLSLNGYWLWDGLDDKGKKLPIGTYIVLTEIFNLQGKKSRFKSSIVLARRL